MSLTERLHALDSRQQRSPRLSFIAGVVKKFDEDQEDFRKRQKKWDEREKKWDAQEWQKNPWLLPRELANLLLMVALVALAIAVGMLARR